MTFVETMENKRLTYFHNPVKSAIINNDPIEDVLHVISVISNPCEYKRRYKLAHEFITRMKLEKSISLYIVELCYNDQKFVVTDSNNKQHLQLRTKEAPIWHKENMINICVKKLLPKDFKAFAFVDMDIEFENVDWADNTLRVLNGLFDVIQPFSHCIDMDKDRNAMNIFSSAGFNFVKGKEYPKTHNPLVYWHPGYSLAMTKKAYDKMGGLYEHSIVGSGDHNMVMSFLGLAANSFHGKITQKYKNDILDFEKRCKGLRFGYIPGVLSHHFHGQKIKRYYHSRWDIVIKHNYNPIDMLVKDINGILIGTKKMPNGLKDDILDYFISRDEDEFLE